MLAMAGAGAALFALLVVAFYRAVSLVMRPRAQPVGDWRPFRGTLAMLLWLLAALDSADTLAHGHESMLPRPGD